jgi:LPS-assembly protein
VHDSRIDGDRLHLGIELERPFESTGYFIRPGARLTHTEYDLNRKDGLDDDPSRSLPSAHLDAGLIFEKNLKNSTNIQTLEPRLYYLHTPFRNQTDIPIFDSAEYEFGFEQLFRDDRFSGSDRVGDADRLSLGLTTRILDPDNGEEKLRASLGRIFYFKDRKVTLPGERAESEDSSEVAVELKIGLSDRWEAIASTLYDTHDDHTEKNTARLQYRSENDFILNMSYRYRRRDIEPIDSLTNRSSSLEQSDISMVLPISDNWRTVARWNYDLQEKRNLELLAGVEYDTCCWKIRLAGRRYNKNTDEDYNNSIEIQLVLKGLARIGSPIGELLERGIRGFDDRDDQF